MKLKEFDSRKRRGGKRRLLWITAALALSALLWAQASALAGAAPAPVLTVSKWASPAGGTIVAPGQTIEYSISYANNTNASMPIAAICDTLSEKVAFVPGSITLNGTSLTDEGHYDANARRVSVDISPVEAGQSGVLRFKVTVAQWEVSRSGFFDEAEWSECGEIVGTTERVYHFVDSLDITKSVTNTSGSVLKRGNVLQWSIVVTNRGIVPATEVVAEDTVPSGTTYVDDSITGPGADTSLAPRLIWRVGTLGVGESVTLTYKSAVNSNVASGTMITNNAMVTSCQGPPKCASETIGPVVVETPIIPVNTAGNEGTVLPVLGLLALGMFGLVRSRREWRLAASLLIVAALVVGAVEAGGGFATAASSKSTGGSAISIPSVGINVKVVEGKTMSALKKGTWRQPPSVKPGQKGTCVIAGHRIPSQFRPLAGAKVGALVYVKSGTVTRTYKIASKTVLSAAKGKLKFSNGSKERLILYTCVPKWQGNKRTVVVAYPVK